MRNANIIHTSVRLETYCLQDKSQEINLHVRVRDVIECGVIAERLEGLRKFTGPSNKQATILPA